MPRGDRTGPNGAGPMTGRGMGFCSGNDRPGFMEPGFGRGMRFRRRFFQQPVMVEEPVALSKEEEKKILEAEKADIEKRLKELK